MAVPNIFANVTTSIPLSQLDTNFATAITLGNTAVYLGNTTTTFGNLTLTNANVSSVSTPITPAQGGTGLATLTANNVLIGNGTSNVTFVAPGTSGNALISNGTVWASSAVPAGSAATPTVLGTVYGKQTASGASPYLTAYGYNAGVSNTGASNTPIGFNAGYNTTSGTNNVSLGDYAGYRINTGASNTIIGSGASTNITTGIGNVALGTDAGNTLTTGSYNIYVGYQTGNTTKTGGVDCIYIGRTITPGNATVNGEMVINTNGNNVTGKGDGTGFIHTGGNLFQGNNSASWATTSDRRLKKNIVDNNEGLNKLTQIQVRNFEYRTEEEITEIPLNQVIKKSGVQLGVIAQELQAVLPDCVKEESSGVLTVDSDNLTWYLINAVKELKAELDALKAKVA
jgi:hypothetical protein